MKVALYMRVSTVDQHCEVQARELIDYCRRRGWEVVADFRDEGISGKANKKRPAQEILMNDAMLHKFDAVIVWKLDRFGRSIMNLLEGINKLKSWGVRFMAVSQNIDTDSSNPTSGLLLNIMAAMAEFERELLIERTNSGLAHARALGKTLGRPRKVFRRDEAIRLHQEGWSLRKIAAELGVGTTLVLKTVKAVEVDVLKTPLDSPVKKS